jgi:hypothetical protein
MSNDAFELFWSAYPRRTAKAKAREAFVKALRKTTIDAMLTALEWQREQASWNDRDADGVLRYVPHPATWLNGERWDDEKPQKKSTSPVLAFKAPTCGDCIDGWREDEMHRVYRCQCRTKKAGAA